MTEYIERGALLKELEAFPHLKTMESVVRSIPAADVVEVVRCKDCLYRVKDGIGRNYCELDGNYAGDTAYCSYGERKK